MSNNDALRQAIRWAREHAFGDKNNFHWLLADAAAKSLPKTEPVWRTTGTGQFQQAESYTRTHLHQMVDQFLDQGTERLTIVVDEREVPGA